MPIYIYFKTSVVVILLHKLLSKFCVKNMFVFLLKLLLWKSEFTKLTQHKKYGICKNRTKQMFVMRVHKINKFV